MSVPSNHVQLFVRAGFDGVSYGACPVCQRFYMVLDLKAKNGCLTYDIVTVNTARPLPEHKAYVHKLPVLKHGDEVIMDTDEIAQYIDDNFKSAGLGYNDRTAHSVCLDVFSKFSFFIKNVSHSPDHLLRELAAIDSFLESSDKMFLTDDHLTHLDCLMLPKFQHIRVASQAFKDWEIPAQLGAFWRYMSNSYKNDTFRKTCPSDQEIVNFWRSKKETTPLPEHKAHFYLMESAPVFSMSVPHPNGV